MSSVASEPCYVSDVTSKSIDLAVGVDFGGTKVLGTLVDPQGNIVAEQRVRTPYDGDQLIEVMTELVGAFEEKAGGPVAGIGVGAAGLVDRNGVLHYGPNVGGVTDVDLKSGIEARLPGKTVVIDNDANVATWAEHLFGAGKGAREMVMVTLGTGIGGGIVVGGQLFRGYNGFAAEVGHMTLVAGGVQCACGKQGCWEAYASGRALGRLGRDAAEDAAFPRAIELAGSIDAIRGEHVTAAAREKDPTALAVLDEFSRWLAIGVTNLIALFDPQTVVIGGGLAEESELFLDSAKRHLADLTFGSTNRPEVPLVVATLGERAGAIGAAMTVHGYQISEV